MEYNRRFRISKTNESNFKPKSNSTVEQQKPKSVNYLVLDESKKKINQEEICDLIYNESPSFENHTEIKKIEGYEYSLDESTAASSQTHSGASSGEEDSGFVKSKSLEIPTKDMDGCDESKKQKLKGGKALDNFVKLNPRKRCFTKFKKRDSNYYSKLKRKRFKHNSNLPPDDEIKEKENLEVYDKAQPGFEVVSVAESEPLYVDLIRSQAQILLNKKLEDFDKDKPQVLSSNVGCFEEEGIIDKIEQAVKDLGLFSLKEEQLLTIRRTLVQKSTLLIAPTNFGKSICYQIPAYLYYRQFKSLTIVISPLISLIEDQIKQLPSSIRGACIHGGLSKTLRNDILYDLSQRTYAILFLAPETLTHNSWSLFKKLPPVSFVCIDEAHCLSTWSHNFRPSYLRICRLLQSELASRCFLGLSATVKRQDVTKITQNLFSQPYLKADDVIGCVSIPENLNLTVLGCCDKPKTLVQLLGRIMKEKNGGVLIYCRRRCTVDMLTSLLKSKTGFLGDGLKWENIESFHAGMGIDYRNKVQQRFIHDTIKILVATCAIGMGLNKSNIRTLIHYDIPNSLEQYVQEIGRGGRDGLPCDTYLLINEETTEELNEIKRNVFKHYSDSQKLTQLVSDVFTPPITDSGSSYYHGIGVDQIKTRLDLEIETIDTLLYFMEDILSQEGCEYFKLISSGSYSNCHVSWYSNFESVKKGLLSCYPTLHSLANLGHYEQNYQSELNCIDVNILQVSNLFQIHPNIVINHLYVLRSCHPNLILEFSGESLILELKKPVSLEKQHEIIDRLILATSSLHNYKLQDIDDMVLFFKSLPISLDKVYSNNNQELRNKIINYFNHPDTISPSQSQNEQNSSLKPTKRIEKEIREELNQTAELLMESYPEHKFSPHSIARILHGIDSPRFPSIVFGNDKRFWRRHLQLDFDIIKIQVTPLVVSYYGNS